MGFYSMHRSVALLLIVTTASQFMPPSPFPYPFQNGQSMSMLHMPNSSPMMQMPNSGSMMQMPNSGRMMQMPNSGPMMQMSNPAPMIPHMPRLPGMPSPPMPMTMPMQLPMNGGRLPMVVMPQRSKKPDKPRRRRRKPRRRRVHVGSSSEESCSKSAEYRRSRKKMRLPSKSARRQVLTPVVSYVTKDGYVVYQKKIKKDRARDWLEMTRGDDDRDSRTNERELKDKIRIND